MDDLATTVTPPPPPGSSGPPPQTGTPLTFSPDTITLTAPVGGPPATQSLTLTYQTFTQGAPGYTSNLNTNKYTGWLSLSPASGTMTQASLSGLQYTYSATIAIRGDPAGLPGGTTDAGTINFTSAGSIVSVPVTLNVSSQPLPSPTGGIANAASAGQAQASVIAPGSYVAIYGTAMAGAGNPSATSLPLPTTLNGAQVTLCGIPMPLLYASATQINALIPDGLGLASTCPLIVITGSAKSAPVQLTVTALQPGIYTVNTSGSGPGIVTNALTGQLITPSNPAHASDFLSIYATGLGPLQGPNGEPAPAVGAAAPSTTVFSTTSNVTATLGGIAAPVLFSGLTPTFAGLYQVNIQVPDTVAKGNSVPLVITAKDPKTGAVAQSNSVTIAIQ